MTSDPLREWHLLSPAEHEEEWAELVAWVTWLHDRYELGGLGGLPSCWPHHPGLIEELRALKAWREQIYESGEPAGQAARYWHNDLRTLITAANSTYARGCASGHRITASLASDDSNLPAEWRSADHAARIPARLMEHSRRLEPADTVSAPAMRSYLTQRLARPLGVRIESIVRYQDRWWREQADGTWQKITDQPFIDRLIEYAQRASDADAAVRDTDTAPAQPPSPEPDSEPGPEHGG